MHYKKNVRGHTVLCYLHTEKSVFPFLYIINNFLLWYFELIIVVLKEQIHIFLIDTEGFCNIK